MQSSGSFHNEILTTLPASDLQSLVPFLETVELKPRQKLENANRKIDRIYFLESGIASIVAISGRGRKQAEVAIIGSEGMTGASFILGSDRPKNDTFIQVEGMGNAIAADKLGALMKKSASMTRIFLHFVNVLKVQSEQTALANAVGKIEERLARWLLMTQDRITGDRLMLTHDFLSVMLGVRRPGVTIGLQRLEQKGLIVTGRGFVSVTDRVGLINLSSGLYGVAEEEYARLFQNASIEENT